MVVCSVHWSVMCLCALSVGQLCVCVPHELVSFVFVRSASWSVVCSCALHVFGQLCVCVLCDLCSFTMSH